MTRNFHRWEVDPFFTAAEEVQDSADRLELLYRTWMHAKSSVDLTANESILLENRRRELSTALGTAKWQLEEFERAVSSLDIDKQEGAVDDAPARHKQFVDALQNQINLIEMSLLNSGDIRDLKVLPAVHLGQEEKYDLALFLCGSKAKSLEDLKKTVFCASSPPSDGKKDEELTSESIKSSNEVSECFSTSASNSEEAFSKAGAKRSDFFCSPQALGFVNERAKDASSVDVCIVQDKGSFYEPVSEHVHVGRGGLSAREGHLPSESVGSGFSSWKCGSADGEGRDSTSVSKFWPHFSKKPVAFDWRLSKSGLKRWKDGDLNSTDHSLMHKLIHKATDLEMGNESSHIGGTFNRSNGHAPGGISGNSLHPKGWSEGLNLLLSFMYAFSTSRFVLKASAILVASVFAGLIFFRMISSAL